MQTKTHIFQIDIPVEYDYETTGHSRHWTAMFNRSRGLQDCESFSAKENH